MILSLATGETITGDQHVVALGRTPHTGDLGLDYMSVSRNTLDVLPSGLSADTLSLRLGIYSRNGSTYDRTIRMTRGGLVRIK